MARASNPDTLACVANLTRVGEDRESCVEFQGLMSLESAGRFNQLTWEHLYDRLAETPARSRLHKYLETKTASLIRAFKPSAKTVD